MTAESHWTPSCHQSFPALKHHDQKVDFRSIRLPQWMKYVASHMPAPKSFSVPSAPPPFICEMGVRIGHALQLFGGFAVRSFRADTQNNTLHVTSPTDGMIHTLAEGVSQPDGVTYLALGESFL